MNQNASFQLSDYVINHAKITFEDKLPKEINISLDPSGIFYSESKIFELSLNFLAFSKDKEQPNVEIKCKANFKFDNVSSFEDIPNFFYVNSIAILFPYLRAFISTFTIQCNIPALVLPTYNLTELGEPFRKASQVK